MLMVGLAVNALSILGGVLNVQFDWNAMPVRFGPVTVDVTVYPPLVLSVLASVWIGPMWGIIPAYLANLASALWIGIPLRLGSLFALAGAIETVIVWGSMVTLNLSPTLHRRRDRVWFLVVGIIAVTTSSLGALIWNASLDLDFTAGQRIRRSWLLGDLAMLVLVVGPLLRWLGTPARRWLERQFGAPASYEVTFNRATGFAVLVLGLLGVVFVAGIAELRTSLNILPGTLTGRGDLLEPWLVEIQFFFGLLVTALVLAAGTFATALSRISDRQRNLARRDALTGCFNRRAFYEIFPREIQRGQRLRQGLSLLFLDIDHFKAVNDHHGHEVGDRVLQQLAVRLQGVIRETDVLFRWGGEEFVILLPHTPPADAPATAERVRASIADRPFVGTERHVPLAVTASLGVAGTLDRREGPDAFVARADAACYRAKQRGRNRVESAQAASS